MYEGKDVENRSGSIGRTVQTWQSADYDPDLPADQQPPSRDPKYGTRENPTGASLRPTDGN
eukprot:CAMPEP_0119490066 /NCGR_PEP_ID=MMETSP1344-20130328/15341_1 /TAXON_ID=236787 /ORGANISM="Florenciella parvula, Strain CCMP2471" /LENGTH=60 /DNA_ID=CAMNT_0007525173 /DNA_START=75 /DNA_END=254 /DNA_ORIENTATION=+